MSNEYHDSAVIEISVRYKIEWKRGVMACQNEAIKLALECPISTYATGLDGGFGATKIPGTSRVIYFGDAVIGT